MDTMTPPSPEYLAESKVTDLYIGYSFPIPLVIISTGLRIWAEFQPGRHGLAFDDYLIVFATLAIIGLCVTALAYGPSAGMGRHVMALAWSQVQIYAKVNLALNHLYNLSSASTKLAVLALYFRVLPNHTFQSIVLWTAVTIVMWLISLEMVAFVLCPNSVLRADGQLAECIDYSSFAVFVSISNLVLDLWVFLLPLPITVRLKVTRKKKMGIALMFSLGLAVCAVCTAKIIVYYTNDVADLTWTANTIYLFSAWEPTGTILCASIPVTYKPLAARFRKVASLPPSNSDQPRQHSHRSWYQVTIGRMRKNNAHLQISSSNDTLDSSTHYLALMSTQGSRLDTMGDRRDGDEEAAPPSRALSQPESYTRSAVEQ